MAFLSALGTAFGLAQPFINSIFGYNQNSHLQNKQFDAQRALQQASFDEWYKQSDYSNNIWKQQQQFSQDLQKQLQAEYWSLYNSPAAQVKNLRAAGLNPLAMLSNDSGSVVSTPQMAPGGSASPPSPSTPVGSAAGASAAPVNSDFAGTLLSLEQARKTAKEGGNTDAYYDALIKQLLGSAENNKAGAALQSVQAAIEDKKLPYVVRQELAMIKRNVALASASEGSEAEHYARAALAGAQKLLTEEVTWKTNLESSRLTVELPRVADYMQSIIDMNNAKATEAVEHAKVMPQLGHYYGSIASTEDALRALRVTANTLDNGLKALDFSYNQETIDDRIWMVSRQLESVGLNNRLLVQQIEKAYKENRVFYVKFATGVLRDLARAFKDTAIGADYAIDAVVKYYSKGLSTLGNAKSKQQLDDAASRVPPPESSSTAGKTLEEAFESGFVPQSPIFKEAFEAWKKSKGKK